MFAQPQASPGPQTLKRHRKR